MLEVRELTKTYQKRTGGIFSSKQEVRALESVSFTLTNGFYGLLGPNGAGKSTLMGLLTDVLERDNGQILWNGTEIRDLGISYRRDLGYVPQQQRLYDNYTGKRFLLYMAALKEIPAREAEERVLSCAETVGLTPHLQKRILAYSGGMKQRLLMAAALLSKPKLLILDEPMAGLDPKERAHLREVLKEFSRDTVVLLATHVVADIESVCDEALFLKQGHLVEKGTMEELLQRYSAGGLEDVYLSIFGDGEEGE